jgi:hypothetical protein
MLPRQTTNDKRDRSNQLQWQWYKSWKFDEISQPSMLIVSNNMQMSFIHSGYSRAKFLGCAQAASLLRAFPRERQRCRAQPTTDEG